MVARAAMPEFRRSLVCWSGDGDLDAVFRTQSTVEWLENVGGSLLFDPVSHIISAAVSGIPEKIMGALTLLVRRELR